MKNSIIKIAGHVENYHWGKVGSTSLIAQYLKNINPETPYAEFWFGAHQRAPSVLVEKPDLNLRQYIKDNPGSVLGTKVTEKFNIELPFLFKILSIEKPLSIQMHPDKINAARLNNKDPKNYPDTNHKPELAIALSEVQLVYGFRPVSEIKKILRKNPEFEMFINPQTMAEINEARVNNNTDQFIRKIYSCVLHAEKNIYSDAANKMIKRISGYAKPNRHERLVLETSKLYGPEDLAIFSILLMNYLVLQPGQGIFIGPNKLHAYLKGDLIECMANSDNVIRAGMTPKFQDISELEKLVEFNMHNVKPINGKSSLNGLETISYPVNCAEFDISIIKGSGNRKIVNKDSNPYFIFCLNGTFSLKNSGNEVHFNQGDACIVPALIQDFVLDSKDSQLVIVTVPTQ